MLSPRLQLSVFCLFTAVAPSLNTPSDQQHDFFHIVKKNSSRPPSEAFVARTVGPPCTCGVPELTNRIVGGSPVDPPNRFPWTVALVQAWDLNSTLCGGALISPNHVVTAYHCVAGRNDSDLRIRLGVFDLWEPPDQSGTYLRSIRSRTSPSQRSGRADLSVLRLDSPVPCGPTVRPVCLPSQGTDFAAQEGQVAGWGYDEYDGKPSRYLQSVSIRVVTTKECQRNYAQIYTPVKKNMLCAGSLDGDKDACKGDSGGPLMCLDKRRQRWRLVGVVSQGTRCATRGFYGLYTNVSFYSNFILRATGNDATAF